MKLARMVFVTCSRVCNTAGDSQAWYIWRRCAMEFARHLLRVFAALLITALASNTTNAGASALYAGQVSEHGSNAADYVQISNAELIEGLSAAITSGGNVNATQIGATVGASGFENNYLTHAEELMRIQAQIDCSQGDQASCETFADLQQLDADRDEFLAGCIGNYSDDCRGIRSHLTRTVAEYVEIAQQLDNAGISSDPTAGLPGYGMERKEALFQFSTYADVNDEFDFSDLVSTDMQSSLARSILQGDLSSATITSVNMLAAADVMQLGAEAGSGILIPLPPGAALSASAMLQIEFGMDVLDAFGLGGGFTSVGGGAIRRTTTDAGAANRGLDDLAQFRDELGLPPAGSAADRSTLAVVEVNGQQIYGINGHGQPVTSVNAISRTHAEIDALNQIQQRGIDVSGQDLTLYVDRTPCTACNQNGGIRSMVEQLGLNQLTVIGPDGPLIIRPR